MVLIQPFIATVVTVQLSYGNLDTVSQVDNAILIANSKYKD